MFRMLKLKPPNGWQGVAWELGIVTLGVLIALAAQQWAEERSWKAKARDATSAIREELADHYAWSVEWRVVYPCMTAQIDRLKQRVVASGDRLDPAPTYSEFDFSYYVMRLPSKDYVSSAWQSAIGDGVTSHLDTQRREELSLHYATTLKLISLTALNDNDSSALLSLSQPIPLDPMVRYSLLRTLNELRGRVAFMDVRSGQLIDLIQKLDMLPPAADAKAKVERFGTYKFCKARGLPMRTFAEAMTAVPN